MGRGLEDKRKVSLRAVVLVCSVLMAVGLVALALCQMPRTLNVSALVGALRSIPPRTIAGALAATTVSYIALLANDFLGLRYAGATPPLTTTLMASFCGYALGNAVGFGSLSGGAVRYRVYTSAGLSAGQVARVTIFIAAASGVGITAATAFGLAMRAHEIARLLSISPLQLYGVAGLVLGLAAFFLIFCAAKNEPLHLGTLRIRLPNPGLVVAQLGITLIDVGAAAAALWILLPATNVDFLGFVTIYAAAVGLGVLSHAPGGFGVFELALFYSVGASGPPNVVAASLVAYRAIYFLIPVVPAITLLAASEIRRVCRQVI
jgi:phosphatidylglycerol lysyltransferase